MSWFALAIADLAAPEGTAGLPRLPALERLLARGERRPGPADFRRWILTLAGLVPPLRLPLASVMAGRPGHWALATPVHLVAGLDRVHLHPGGLPATTPAELAAIAASFNAALGGDGLALEPAGPSLGLLSLARPVSADTHDPAPLAGREAGAWLPSGPDGGWLRRLMTEAQMLLHGHPVNSAREARGEAPVNGLWLWGTGGEALPALPAGLPPLETADPFLAALWRNSAGTVSAPAAAFGDRPPGPRIVTLDLAALGGTPAEALERAEAQWFAPLERALAPGGIERLDLFVAGRALRAAPRHRLKFWRRARPWQEAVA